MILFILYIASLLFSAVSAVINYKYLKSRRLFIFIPYLILLFIQELGVYLYYLEDPTRSTALVYNIYRPVTACFFAYLYYKVSFNVAFRKVIIILVTSYLTAFVIVFTRVQSIYTYNNYLNLAGGLVITCCAIFFLFNYFKLDNPVEEKKWLPLLWITIGVVSFYPVVNISFTLYWQLQSYNNSTVGGVKIHQIIPRVMSIFMYGCFAWAFYLCRKKNSI
jgi:hypothetical protein